MQHGLARRVNAPGSHDACIGNAMETLGIDRQQGRLTADVIAIKPHVWVLSKQRFASWQA
jgi:hypothetical protein